MSNKNNELMQQFNEGRAIYFAMIHGAISYEQAKILTTPLLRKLNTAMGLIAKKHNVKATLLIFHDFGKNI